MVTFLRLRERNQRERESKKSKDGPRKSNHNLDEGKGSSQADKENEKCGNDGANPSPKKIILHCKFHPGKPTWNGQRKVWQIFLLQQKHILAVINAYLDSTN